MTPPGEDPWGHLKEDELNEERIQRRETMSMVIGKCSCGESYEFAVHSLLGCRLMSREERDAVEAGKLAKAEVAATPLRREQDREFEEGTSLNRTCMECGQSQDMHALVNYSDGNQVGRTFLICPRSTFTPYR